RLLRLAILLVVLIAAAVFAWRWWTVGRFFISTDNAYLRADISVLTPRVGGEIVALKVRDNQTVAAGDLLLEIDRRDYAARVDSARAAVAEAQAALAGNGQQRGQQDAAIAEARAQVAAARASEVQTRGELDRARSLLKDGVATRQRLDNAEAAHLNAVASVARAAAGVQAAERALTTLTDSSRARLEAALAASQAQLKLAEIDLASTSIVAPVAGTVGDLAARLGERVQPGQRLLSLVPLDQLYVEANFKETQLNKMRIGQPVEIDIDAFPNAVLHGHVDSFSPASGAEWALLPAQNATGNFTKIVQRVPVRIALDDKTALAGRLRPGLSVEASVDTRAEAGAAKQ
ncbi:HlyD family secretion protein, partial [uncultured Nevskia sp.]|uniref:HlyD family secretion protein n=1 Tax=uncultured Nevskia sp. TaxID=228950 RepID=UPI0025DC9321